MVVGLFLRSSQEIDTHPLQEQILDALKAGNAFDFYYLPSDCDELVVTVESRRLFFKFTTEEGWREGTFDPKHILEIFRQGTWKKVAEE